MTPGEEMVGGDKGGSKQQRREREQCVEPKYFHTLLCTLKIYLNCLVSVEFELSVF